MSAELAPDRLADTGTATPYAPLTLVVLKPEIPRPQLGQETAASIGAANYVGDKLYIGCRSADLNEPNALLSLSAREYEILSFMATGQGPAGIAESFSISERTAEGHQLEIFKKLGVATAEQAACFIPIEEERLRVVPFHARTSAGRMTKTLGPVEEKIFTLIGEGYSREQIADQSNRATSTIRSQYRRIASKLGLQDETGASRITMYRVAGAYKNLASHQEELHETVSRFQPQIIALLSDIDKAHNAETLNIYNDPICRLENPTVAEDLKSGNYLSPRAARYNHLNLEDLIAALLIKNPLDRRTMLLPLMQPVVAQIIRQETRHFLTHRQLISD